MEENCPALAKRLALARTQRGLTQVEAAHQMGMSSATLSVLERRGNIGTARFVDLLAVCQFYGWSLDEVAALCDEARVLADGLPADVSLMLRGLPEDKKALVFSAVEAMARGLRQEAEG